IQEELMDGLEGPADLVFSDMSPNLSGIRFRDNYESHQLGLIVLSVAKKILKTGGSLVLKIFPGDELVEFMRHLRINFQQIKTYFPEDPRKGSSEIYLIAQQFKA